jgi:hypothetical protein
METKKTVTNNLTQHRFRVTLFLLRLGGVSIYVDKTSKGNFLYNCTVTICAYAVFMAMIMDFIVHRDDLQRAMKTFRVIVACILIFWMHLSVR